MIPDHKKAQLASGFAEVINRLSVDNDLGTPDHLLGLHLVDTLMVLDRTQHHRALWLGQTPPGDQLGEKLGLGQPLEP